MSSKPVRLEASFYERVWGVTVSSGPQAGMKLGEMWFEAQPLLLKFIFTSDKLSVQVHPDDAYAARHEAARGGRGKTEMWYVVEAKPGARLAIGLKQEMTREELRRAALDGSLEGQLRWFEVHPGQAVFVPAGTIHAIGPGLTLCEIQQYCDLTYRLFDYGRLDHGRPRELHLEKALDVVRSSPRAGLVSLPFSCEYFRVARYEQGLAPHGLLVDLSGLAVWRIKDPVEFEPTKPFQCLSVTN
jgi:mannose-6-phosphate isomerase